MTGILVAAWVPGETGKQIALASGEPVSQMHITLLYYPEAEPGDLPGIVAAAAPVAFRNAPLVGAVSGRGRFYGDESDVIYAVPSLDGLAELRGELQAAIREAGYTESTKHGWNPHITLKYVESDEPSPFSEYSDSDRERLLSFVTKKEGCWLWTGAKNAKGYGIFKVNGKAMRAHRVSYEMAHGEIDPDLQILHDPVVCNNTSCINPRHLRQGDNSENVADRYGKKAAAEERAVPLEIRSIEVRYGDEFRIELPFGDIEEDEDEVFDMTETADVPDWDAVLAWEFAEWFGYNIEPNPDSVLGFRVTSPSGKTLGGAVARRIIEASQKTPDAGGGAKGKGKKGGKGKAKPKVDPAVALAEAKTKAQEAFDKIDPIGMEDKSDGILKGAHIQDLLKGAQEKLAGAKDAKEARAIVAQLKKDIAAYKNELMPKPTAQVARERAVAKIADSLPSPNELAGDRYDPAEIKAITDKFDVAGARSPEKARELAKQMRTEVAAYKKEAAAKQKAAKQEAAAIKKAAKDAGTLQTAAADKGWETVEVIKGSPADMAAYREKITELAKQNPDKQYTVVKAADGSFGLLVKPNADLKATPSAVPAKEPNLVGAIPEPNKPKQPVTASEWAEYYTDQMFTAEEPETFHAAHDQKAHGRGGRGPLSEEEQKTALAKLATMERIEMPGASMSTNLPDDWRLGIRTADVGFMDVKGITIYGEPSSERHTAEVTVPVSSLRRGQVAIPQGGVEAYIKNLPPDLPEIARNPAGELHITSGHTRLAAQALAGRKEVDVKIYDVDERGRQIKKKPVWEEPE